MSLITTCELYLNKLVKVTSIQGANVKPELGVCSILEKIDGFHNSMFNSKPKYVLFEVILLETSGGNVTELIRAYNFPPIRKYVPTDNIVMMTTIYVIFLIFLNLSYDFLKLSNTVY